MPHLEPEQLSLHALEGRDSLGEEAQDHLDGCDACRGELAALVETVRRTRAAGPVREALPQPPPQVWEAIVAARDAAEGAGDARFPAPPTAPRASVRILRRPPLRAAAVLVVAAVLTGGLWLSAARPAADLLTTVTLAPSEDAEPVEARLFAEQDLHTIVVDAAPAEPGDGYLEVWLLAEDLSDLVSLGPLEEGAPVAVPEGVDLAAYPVLDISREPHDGDPGHSGDSVARGRLAD